MCLLFYFSEHCSIFYIICGVFLNIVHFYICIIILFCQPLGFTNQKFYKRCKKYITSNLTSPTPKFFRKPSPFWLSTLWDIRKIFWRCNKYDENRTAETTNGQNKNNHNSLSTLQIKRFDKRLPTRRNILQQLWIGIIRTNIECK